MRPAALRAENRADRTVRRVSSSILIPLFLVSLAIPVNFNAGPLRLSADRIILITLLIPCVIAWLSGRLGRIRVSDVLILLTAMWGVLALTIHHGVAATWQTSGILVIETFGGYLLARRLIRSQEDFRAMVRAFFWLICALLPLAVIETLTERKPLLDAFAGFGDVAIPIFMEPRRGLYRVQAGFEHPILFGVFCASGLGLVYYVMGLGRFTASNLLRSSVVALAAILSLSSGAITSIAVQFGLAAWDTTMRFVRRRWMLFGILCLIAYVVVDILSNRSPFHVFIAYLTFTPSTGYGRILIFQYGSAEVMRNPVFGIGQGEWARLPWMLGTMDNFWLVVAVRYGLPAFLFLAGAVFFIVRALSRLKLDDERMAACRMGLLVSLGGLVIAGITVHYWNAVYVWFMFVIGSGHWMLDEADKATPNAAPEDSTRKALGSRQRRPGK